jgi:hypothetical protein
MLLALVTDLIWSWLSAPLSAAGVDLLATRFAILALGALFVARVAFEESALARPERGSRGRRIASPERTPEAGQVSLADDCAGALSVGVDPGALAVADSARSAEFGRGRVPVRPAGGLAPPITGE